ncbi:MAG: DUF4339 domain-containing protein [Prevotella sp.]|nr:DUF4339 domain-containing protein [Prevotella sp.]
MNETVIRFYVVLNDEQQGPYTIEQLQKMGLDSDMLVWKAGMADWTPAGEVDVLRNIVRPPVPEPPAEIPEEPAVVPPPAPSVVQMEPSEPPLQEPPVLPIQEPSMQTPPPQDIPPRPQSNDYGPVPPVRESFIGRHKGWFIFLFFLAVLCAVLAVTNPDEKKHQAAISQLASDIIEQQVDDIFDDPYSGFGTSVLTSGIVDKVAGHMVTVKDYGLFSLGQLEYGDEKKTVSFGILGHVFTFSNEDVERYITNQQTKRQVPRIQEDEDEDDDDSGDSRYTPPVLHDQPVVPDDPSATAPDTIDLF